MVVEAFAETEQTLVTATNQAVERVVSSHHVTQEKIIQQPTCTGTRAHAQALGRTHRCAKHVHQDFVATPANREDRLKHASEQQASKQQGSKGDHKAEVKSRVAWNAEGSPGVGTQACTITPLVDRRA